MFEKNRYLQKICSFFDSSLLQYLYLLAAIGVDLFSKVTLVGITLTFHNRVVIYAVICFVAMISLQVLLCKHLVNTVLPFLLVITFSLKCYGAMDEFMKIAYMAAPLILALLLRLLVFSRRAFHIDDIFHSLWPVAIAVTVGGLGTLAWADYLHAIYYVIGLGVGMLLLYYIFQSQYQADQTYHLEADYERAMCLTALFCAFMILHYYYQNIETVKETHTLLDFQWRNNISTILIITLPFLFNRAHKHFVWFPLGFLVFGSLLLAGSRGGTLFGSLEFIVCILAYILNEKTTYRRIGVAICIVCLGILIAIGIKNRDALTEFFGRFFRMFTDKEHMETETRYQLIFRAKEDFLRNPIFGSGLGYSGNTDIYNPAKGALYFYHSAPLQIIGSLGIVGCLAYGCQFFFQGRFLWRNRSRFVATIAISMIALWGMSIVNPGVFAPVPYAMILPLHLCVVQKSTKKKEL